VQNATAGVELLHAIHGRSPARLGEDFCGTAAISRAWVARSARHRAVALDLDPVPLAFAADRAAAAAHPPPRLALVRGDARRTPLSRLGGPASLDCLFVGNFSIGEIHARPALVAYLKRCRRRLGPRGVFVCDTYGGPTAFSAGSLQRTLPGPPSIPGATVRYTWQQRLADPLTARVENALHFRVLRGRDVLHELTDAFVYRWRLWSIPELRDALAEAGFSHTDVYDQLPDAKDAQGRYHLKPLASGDDLGERDQGYVVCIAARTTA
jgi:SAM-dependent methyltransferase